VARSRLTVATGGLSILIYLVGAGGLSAYYRLSAREVLVRPNSSPRTRGWYLEGTLRAKSLIRAVPKQ
jgi:hypothetical protein